MNRTERDTDSAGIPEVDLEDLLARLTFDGSVPTDREAAAAAAAIAAHRTDRAVAAAAATAESEAETIPEWTFSSRLRSTGVHSRRRPRNVERGGEWRAASRSL